MPARSHPDVIVIGAGLAGLHCAVIAQQAGFNVMVVEAGKKIGGRAQTDVVDGHQLDRGFHVLLTAYPEAKKVFDYQALKLKPFFHGALVYYNGKMHKVADPVRHPVAAGLGLFSPIGEISDKFKALKIRDRLMKKSIDGIFQDVEKTAAAYLKDEGISSSMIERFFRPFFGAVTLDSKLLFSSRVLEFLIRMLAEGDTSMPEQGIGALAQQLADKLTPGAIRTEAPVASVQEGLVNLKSGETLVARAIVVATDGQEAARLVSGLHSVPNRQATCVYYTAQQAPIEEPMLILNGEGKGLVNNLAVVSNANRACAPEGSHLIAVTLLGRHEFEEQELDDAVRAHLNNWFGKSVVETWRYLKSYHVSNALPDQSPPTRQSSYEAIQPGIFACGDFRELGFINGALVSGRKAAEAVIKELGTGNKDSGG